MKIGVPTEIKPQEYRVAMTPSDVRSYASRGHTVTIQAGAGVEAGFADEAYRDAGAAIDADRDRLFAESKMIVKVKEPQAEEIALLRDGQILFTYLHLAADRALTEELLACGVRSVAYETIETDNGRLPCLTPMSEIAGRLAVQEGAKYLEKPFGGRGILLGGVPGIPRANVAILGGGVVGTNACKIAVGMGAAVTVLDIDAGRMAHLDDLFDMRITTLYSTEANIDHVVADSDLIIGAVLRHGAKAPRLIRREHLGRMRAGAVLVDVAVDQGGCFETTRPTTHADPVYLVDGIVHYAVANMPGAVALSSTQALTSTTLPYGLLLAEHGLAGACRQSPALARGVNTYDGRCTCPGVAATFALPLTPISELLEG
ncbi:MAG: alanine dehydrogenase [Planctomycetota bacterium]